MLFSEYLHEKAEESRHNETIGYLITIIGSIFFVGGLLETVITVENPEWFLIIPYHLTPSIQPFRIIPNFSWHCAINFRHSPEHPLRERKSMVYETNPKSTRCRRIKTQKEGTKRIRESKLIAL